MFWLSVWSGYTALLNSFLDVLILAQKQRQDSQLLCRFPHAETNNNSGDLELEERGKLSEPINADGFTRADDTLLG